MEVQELRRFRATILEHERHHPRDLTMRRRFNHQLRRLRGGGGSPTTFYFISDIEGSKAYLETCYAMIPQERKARSHLCFMGDTWDDGTAQDEIDIWNTVQAIQRSGHWQEVHFLLGNRDLNKIRLQMEGPHLHQPWTALNLQEGQNNLDFVPADKPAQRIYPHAPTDYPKTTGLTPDEERTKDFRVNMSRQQLGTVGEVRSMSSIHLGIRLNQEKYTEKLRCENMDELMAAYYAYIHNGDIFKEVKGFRLAHGSICSAYAHRTPCDAFYMQQHSNRAVEALKDTLKNVQPVTLSELSPADQETYYTPRTPGDTRWYNKVYENQYFGNNRVIADLSLQYNRDAATHLGFQTDAWDGKFHVTENQRFLPPESLPENPNELWGAVGHQPVGFFPCVIHNALHTDVSYASIGTPTRKKTPRTGLASPASAWSIPGRTSGRSTWRCSTYTKMPMHGKHLQHGKRSLTGQVGPMTRRATLAG